MQLTALPRDGRVYLTLEFLPAIERFRFKSPVPAASVYSYNHVSIETEGHGKRKFSDVPTEFQLTCA